MPTKPPIHRPRRQAASRQPKRPTAARRGYDRAWQKLRAEILAVRSTCELCPAPSTELHHRVPKVLGGTNGTSNLQALCKSCHSRITAQTKGTLRRHGTGAGHVELVYGPPGAGKTSYVMKRRLPGDLIIDVDRLYVAVTGLEDYDKPEALLPTVLATRDAVVYAIANRIGSTRKLWIITSGATERDRRRALGPIPLDRVHTTLLCPSADECYRRIAADPRRADQAHRWRPIIEQWFRAHRGGDHG